MGDSWKLTERREELLSARLRSLFEIISGEDGLLWDPVPGSTVFADAGGDAERLLGRESSAAIAKGSAKAPA